jgi:16S rRNA processing protein RimM
MIAMAEIVGVHGVRGMVKLKIYGDNPDVLPGYSPYTDSTCKKTFTLNAVVQHGSIHLAEIDGVADRTAAEKLRGTVLYIDRALLPKIKDADTYYHADLIGMAAIYPDGRAMGKITGVANFGAGDLLDVKPVKGASFYVPFTNEVVPDVNMDTRTVTIDPPHGLLD